MNLNNYSYCFKIINICLYHIKHFIDNLIDNYFVINHFEENISLSHM